MGRTLPPASIVFLRMKEDFKKFEKALAPSDQRALGELFVYANKHIAEAQFASSPFPEDIFILAMLLEMHKEVINLEMVIVEQTNKTAGLKE
jgi:hypothetical protein